MANTPRSRKDDYPQAILHKLKQVYKIASERADMVLFGGDFFNAHKMFSYSLLNEVIEIVNCDIQTHAIIGQHDLSGYNIKTYPNSTLGFMESHCKSWNTIWDSITIDSIDIHACHVCDNLEDRLLVGNGNSILMAHKLINDKTAMFDVYVTSELESNHRLVLSGDLHDGFKVHEYDDTIYCNPGALARQSYSDRNRPVQVVLIDTENWSLEMVQLEYETDVFEKSLSEELKGVSIDGFVDSLESMDVESVDLRTLIESNAKKENLSSGHVEYIMGKLESREGN